MAVEVADGLDLVCLAVELDLVALHDLLDVGAHVAQPRVDARRLDAHLGGLQRKEDQYYV